jgi:hypothetical protein
MPPRLHPFAPPASAGTSLLKAAPTPPTLQPSHTPNLKSHQIDSPSTKKSCHRHHTHLPSQGIDIGGTVTRGTRIAFDRRD